MVQKFFLINTSPLSLLCETTEQSMNLSILFLGIKLALELKKEPTQQRFPLYLADVEGASYYIIPLRGAGLWDAIWGYIALESDRNTIKGAVFDHKAETAGLGAEITQQWFMDRFVGEKVFDNDGKLVGISVSKTNNDPKDLDKNDHEVDAISGATITGDGVSDMIIERLTHYQPYLEQMQTYNNCCCKHVRDMSKNKQTNFFFLSQRIKNLCFQKRIEHFSQIP